MYFGTFKILKSTFFKTLFKENVIFENLQLIMDNREENYATLLNQLKIAVENLLSRNSDNLWEVYESLHRLHIAVVDIVKHGFRFFKENVRYTISIHLIINLRIM